jgi:hypothetical protein
MILIQNQTYDSFLLDKILMIRIKMNLIVVT